MKVYSPETEWTGMQLTVRTTDRVDVVDVTSEVESAIPADTETGLCHVYVPHTTAGIVVNEPEDRLLDDVESFLATLVPQEAGYGHDAIDDNADAHLRSLLLGESVTVPIQDGTLALGTWQAILLVDGDGPRTRRLTVTLVE